VIEKMKPISEKFLNPNDLLAIKFDEGWIFTRVLAREPVMYKPFNLSSVNATSHTDYGRLNDSSGNDVIYIDKATPPRILHGAIGIKPNSIRLYIRYPEGSDIIGKPPNVNPPTPSSGSDYGYLTGEESPYDEPTDYMELVIPPKIHLSFEYYNTDSIAHTPALNLQFMLYEVQLLTDKKLIQLIATRKIPCAFRICGTVYKQISYEQILRKDWKIDPLTLDEASKGGGSQ